VREVLSYDCIMAQLYDTRPSPSSALIQLARIKAGLSQQQLARRASVPATMISAYERGKREPSLNTLLKLLHAAGFELTMKLEPYETHDELLEAMERERGPRERKRRDRQIEAWRSATPVAGSS
jgi:transcriptional regulator with XRE-family HTH domain